MTLTRLFDKTAKALFPEMVIDPRKLKDLTVFRVPKINDAPRPDPLLLQVHPTRWGLVLTIADLGPPISIEERETQERRARGEALRKLATEWALERPDERLTRSKVIGGLFKAIPGLAKHDVAGVVDQAVEDGFLVQQGRKGRGGGLALYPSGENGRVLGVATEVEDEDLDAERY